MIMQNNNFLRYIIPLQRWDVRIAILYRLVSGYFLISLEDPLSNVDGYGLFIEPFLID